jgi:type IV secretion system protein VirD4
MKPTARISLSMLTTRLYPVETAQQRAWTLVRFLLVLWFGASTYTAVVVLPALEPQLPTRVLTALCLGLAGPLVPQLPLPAESGALWVTVGSRGVLLLFLGVLLFLTNPPASARTVFARRVRDHAASQGREHPAALARSLPKLLPDIPLLRVGRQDIGVQCGTDSGHIAVIAPTRSGKGLHLTQTLLRWPAGAVVVDPKGEQWARTASHRARVVGPVYRLPPSGIDLLGYFDSHDALDRRALYELLLQPWRDRDPVFTEKCQALFEAAVAVADAASDHPLRVLTSWTAQRPAVVLQQARLSAAAAVDRFLDGDSPDKPNRFTLTAWGTFTARLAPLAPHLATWTVPDVPADWAARRATIYLCYPLPQIQAAGGLVGAILAALLRGQVARSATTVTPTLCAIDELPAVGLRGLDTYLATVGSAGVTMLFYAQALTQLEQVYERAGARTILGNCHHQVFYPPRDVETAQYVSKLFGTTLTQTYSSNRGLRTSSDGQHEQVREALSVAELLALPEQAVVALTMVGGRQVRLLGERIDPRTIFSHLPTLGTNGQASEG